MADLARAIDRSTSPILLTSAISPGSLPAPYTLDSENILVVGGSGTDYVSVDRGENGTASAAHAVGTMLVAGWGGGGVQTVSLTDGTTTVDPTTSIRVASVSDGGGGLAVLAPIVASAADPGAIGPNQLWLQLDPDDNGYALQLWHRNVNDDGWDPIGTSDRLISTETPTTTGGMSIYDSDGNQFAQVIAQIPSGAGSLTLTTLDAIGQQTALIRMGVNLGDGSNIRIETTSGMNIHGGLSIAGAPVGTQCANQAAINPEVTDADTAFNALRTAMIASGLMAPDTP